MKFGDKERKHHRLNTEQVTELRQSDLEESMVEVDAHIKNLSLGGAFIETTMLFPKGSVVDFKLSIPNVTEPIPVRAVIRHLKTKPDPGMGVEFLNISVEHSQALKEYIENYGRI